MLGYNGFPNNILIYPKNDFWEIFGGNIEKGDMMLKKNYKGRCERKSLTKCNSVCRLYSKIQSVYADLLEHNPEIVEFRCNVLLDGIEEGEYTTDFVCTKVDGTLRVRECVERKYLTKPGTVKLMELSRQFWYVKRGVTDWGIVVDKKKEGESDEN